VWQLDLKNAFGTVERSEVMAAVEHYVGDGDEGLVATVAHGLGRIRAVTDDGVEVELTRGVVQGDPTSMITFAAVVTRRLASALVELEGKGLRGVVLSELDGGTVSERLVSGEVDVLLAAYADDVTILARDAGKARVMRDILERQFQEAGMSLAAEKEEVAGVMGGVGALGEARVCRVLTVLGVPVAEGIEERAEALRRRIREVVEELRVLDGFGSPLAELYVHRLAGLHPRLQWVMRAVGAEVVDRVKEDVREAERIVLARILRCDVTEVGADALAQAYVGLQWGGLGLRSLLTTMRAEVKEGRDQRVKMDAEERAVMGEVEMRWRALGAEGARDLKRLLSLKRESGGGVGWLGQDSLLKLLDEGRPADEEALALRNILGLAIVDGRGAKCCPGGHSVAQLLGDGGQHLTLCKSLVVNQRHDAMVEAVTRELRACGFKVDREQSVAPGGGSVPRSNRRGVLAPGDAVVTVTGPGGTRKVWLDGIVVAQGRKDMKGEALCNMAYMEKMTAHLRAIAKAGDGKLPQAERESLAALASIEFLPVACDSYGGVAARTHSGMVKLLGLRPEVVDRVLMAASAAVHLKQARGMCVARARLAAMEGKGGGTVVAGGGVDEERPRPDHVIYEVLTEAEDEDESEVVDGAYDHCVACGDARSGVDDDDDEDDGRCEKCMAADGAGVLRMAARGRMGVSGGPRTSVSKVGAGGGVRSMRAQDPALAGGGVSVPDLQGQAHPAVRDGADAGRAALAAALGRYDEGRQGGPAAVSTAHAAGGDGGRDDGVMGTGAVQGAAPAAVRGGCAKASAGGTAAGGGGGRGGRATGVGPVSAAGRGGCAKTSAGGTAAGGGGGRGGGAAGLCRILR
jgi:hypothetical protein